MSGMGKGPFALWRGRATVPSVASAGIEGAFAISVVPRDDGHRARLTDLERLSASGERGIRHEVSMRRKRIWRRGRSVALITAIGRHVPALRLILQQRHHDLILNLLVH